MDKKEMEKMIAQAQELRSGFLEVCEKQDPELGILLSVLVAFAVQTGLEAMDMSPMTLVSKFAEGVESYTKIAEQHNEEEGEDDEQTISRTTH